MCDKIIKMRRIYLFTLIFLIAFLLLTGRAVKFNNPSSSAGTNEVIVKHVIDGDTILVEINGTTEKVRLIGINTPEIHHPTKGVERYGYEAKRFTSGLLKEGDRIKLEFDLQKRDKYGRLLAYVYLSDGRFLNALLVQEGYAQVYTIPPNVKYQELFVKLQKEARAQGRGLWSDRCAESECPTKDNGAIQESAPVVQDSEPGLCNFVASKVADVFHKPDCEWAKKIKPWNRQCFRTREDALKAHKRACKVCMP